MKKPGEFKKQQAKHKKIQHNRDQLKLMREGLITKAELFIMEKDGLKKVTVIPVTDDEGFYPAIEAVFHMHNKGLVRDIIVNKDGISGINSRIHIDSKDIFGIVDSVESASNNPKANVTSYNKLLRDLKR